MDSTAILTIGSVVVLLHLLANAHVSKEVYQWEPSLKRRLFLFICVWFIPFVGLAIAYKSLSLHWFTQKSKSTSLDQNSVSGAFLEVDSIFNPGQKHVIEAQQKETIENREEGDLYKKQQADLNTIKPDDVPRNKNRKF